jgi:hypothetical protein
MNVTISLQLGPFNGGWVRVQMGGSRTVMMIGGVDYDGG